MQPITTQSNHSNLYLRTFKPLVLKQVFGDLDILSFVRIGRLKWIGHVNRMENKRTASQVFNNNP
jgi:hypothetical protein